MRFITALEYFFLEKIIITAVSHGARTVYETLAISGVYNTTKQIFRRLGNNWALLKTFYPPHLLHQNPKVTRIHWVK